MNTPLVKETVLPFEPTDAMWDGLARELVAWRGFSSPTGKALYTHLNAYGIEPPAWLYEEIRDENYVPPAGTVAAVIYKAMFQNGYIEQLEGMSVQDCEAVAVTKTRTGTKELLPIKHIPVRPARPGSLGEHVFLNEWVRYVESPLEPSIAQHHDDGTTRLDLILANMEVVVSQRHATVCASFITWLGTNCGRGFLLDARQAAKHESARNPFLKAWADENHRRVGISRGVRVLEHVLAPADHFGDDGLTRLPALSVEDYETIDHLVCWLEGTRGTYFIQRCWNLIDNIYRKQRKLPNWGMNDPDWFTRAVEAITKGEPL